MKEPYSYEMVGDAANLPHTERLLSPFFVSRRRRAAVEHDVRPARHLGRIGWYNDWRPRATVQRLRQRLAARVTALPLRSEDGLATFTSPPASATTRATTTAALRGKPASHVADVFVDTGNLAGDHAWNTGLETLWT